MSLRQVDEFGHLRRDSTSEVIPRFTKSPADDNLGQLVEYRPVNDPVKRMFRGDPWGELPPRLNSV
jgi:hypothetical protein